MTATHAIGSTQPHGRAKPWYRQLWAHVAAAMVIGELLGHFYPTLGAQMEPLGDGFIKVVGLVIPTGYSFNLDGTRLYLATAAVFLAQATNTPLDISQQIGLLLILLLTSKGAAGITVAAFVVLAATLAWCSARLPSSCSSRIRTGPALCRRARLAAS